MKNLLIVSLVVFGLAALTHNASGQSAKSESALHFSSQPDKAEIFNARVFDEPLLPIGGEPSAEENKALANALSTYAARTNFDDPSSFNNFLERFPNSTWSGSLLLHLGTEYYNNGHYSKALDSWERAWQDLKNTDDPKGKHQADRAAGELARMYSKLGRMAELDDLLASVSNRSFTGPGAELIHFAQQGLWLMHNRPDISFKCGPYALSSILSEKDPFQAANPLIILSQSTTNGIPLFQVAQLSQQLGMNYQMAFRSPGAPWILPSVIHWKVGHYAALLRQEGNRFLVKDHTFQSSVWITATTLEDESSGYFLIPPGPIPAGWRHVSEAESQGIWGKGNVGGQNGNGTGPSDGPSSGGSGSGGDGGGPGGGGGGDGSGGGDGGSCGMTTYTMHTMLANLNLYDTPVGYKPPVGPWVKFIVYYNQNEANQPSTFYYSNLGPDWDCNWIAYITDNPNSPGAGVTSYGPGGGTHSFTGFNSTNKTFAPELYTQAVLVQTSSSTYELQFPNGTRKEFTQSDGSTGSTRRIFMTQVIDAAGNVVQLHYDSSLRITNIVDAIGQVTTLAYGNATYSNAITKVTDPFGRSASFQYNAQGLLSQITDVLGITSQYTYGSNDFITVLTTPYGTTTFSSGTTNGGPWLQATDPLGESEFAEAPLNPIAPNTPDPSATVPTNMLLAPFNTALDYRDTYFWGKQAFVEGTANLSAATIYHFCHDVNLNIESGVLESIKKPLENRIWFDHPGESVSYQLGSQSINKPSAIGRVLDDGSSQTSYYSYNPLGNPTNSTDPLGRNFTYVYSTNNVDLLQVLMTSHGRNELQSAMTYNSQHRPLTITDTSGQTTTNTYNARGQILSTTDPLGEVTSYNYNSNGYLTNIVGHLQNNTDITSFTYDGFGRIHTVTDTEGYTLIYAYDAMDRVTNVTHPDGTTEQFVYSNLDLLASADRQGRWTTNMYNADRQLISRRDPLGRITQYQYCYCGALEALFDPAGNETSWDHDVQSRVTAKHYADGSTINYVYESTTSRLHSRLDEKGQQTMYQHYRDDNLESVSYSNAIVSTPAVSFAYDTNYNRLVTMQDGIGTTAYAYNPVTTTPALGAGRLASVSGPLPNSMVTYQYDQLGRVANRSINGVPQVTTFDSLGRVAAVTNALGAFQYSYIDATPRLALEAYPNGQTNLYSYYNTLGDERLLQIQHLYPNGSLLSGFGYAYNSVGQITAWTNMWDTLSTQTLLPGYDAADQLTNVSVAGSSPPVANYSYAYDLAGNRTLVETNGIQTQYYYNALNQIAGSSVTLPNVTYQWDAENRLVAINQGTNTSEFSYDGLGRRLRIVEKTNGVVQSDNYYLWCGTQICELRDASGATVLRRLFPQGESLVGANGSTNYFYTRDHLGSVREAVGANGLLATRYNYDPYGQKSVVQENFQTTFGFTGDFLHQKSGLYLTWLRPMDSISGRWLSRDPLGEKINDNLYSYVANNPLGYIDPYGLCDNGNSNGNNANPTSSSSPSLEVVSGTLESVTEPSAEGLASTLGFDEVGSLFGGALQIIGAIQVFNNVIDTIGSAFKQSNNQLNGGYGNVIVTVYTSSSQTTTTYPDENTISTKTTSYSSYNVSSVPANVINQNYNNN
jgi:RHS repeat-associated protein